MAMTLLSGSKLDAISYEYEHKCLGSHTYDCVYMFDQMRIDGKEHEIKSAESEKDGIIKKFGEKKYIDAIDVEKSNVVRIKADEPSFFMRFFSAETMIFFAIQSNKFCKPV